MPQVGNDANLLGERPWQDEIHVDRAALSAPHELETRHQGPHVDESSPFFLQWVRRASSGLNTIQCGIPRKNSCQVLGVEV